MHIEYKPGTYVQLCVCVYMLSCLTFCGPMDYSLAGSSVHGILQARILEWVAISSSRGSYWPGDQTWVSCVSCIGKCILYHCTPWQAICMVRGWEIIEFLNLYIGKNISLFCDFNLSKSNCKWYLNFILCFALEIFFFARELWDSHFYFNMERKNQTDPCTLELINIIFGNWV